MALSFLQMRITAATERNDSHKIKNEENNNNNKKKREKQKLQIKCFEVKSTNKKKKSV